MEERLQRYLARCGVASRRKAEELILQGRVQVDGITITRLGAKVDPSRQRVVVDGVPVEPEDTEETLAERILRFEHRIYPQAVKWFVDGRVRVEGRKVVVEGADYSSLPVVPALEEF